MQNECRRCHHYQYYLAKLTSYESVPAEYYIASLVLHSYAYPLTYKWMLTLKTFAVYFFATAVVNELYFLEYSNLSTTFNFFSFLQVSVWPNVVYPLTDCRNFISVARIFLIFLFVNIHDSLPNIAVLLSFIKFRLCTRLVFLPIALFIEPYI